jgi:hypothetical protein
MSDIEEAAPAQPQYRRLLRGPMILLALIIIVRFVLEAAGVPLDTTRFLSASVVYALAEIYVGAVAPLYGVTRFGQLALPALVLSTWFCGWTALSLIISGVFQLQGSHFAHASGPGVPLYPNFGFHVFEHIALILIAPLATLGVMAVPYSLHRWPVVVAPGSLLGGLVVMRFAVEAMNLAPTSASAWSSTVGLLLGALYLGGIGPPKGVRSPRQLLAPALALGWIWRFWIFLAALVSATLGYKSHFFDRSQGRVAFRLLELFGGEVIAVGFGAGLLVWGIAVCASRAIHPLART